MKSSKQPIIDDSNPSRPSHSLEQSSADDSGDDNQIKAYVTEFKKEVERKFQASKTNSRYRFPRKTIQNELSRPPRDASLESLNDVTFYDLDSQNVKRALANPLTTRRISETDFLVEVIKRLGKLDQRYLASQMRNQRSSFFKILYSSLQRKVQKDRKSVESLKSCSVKTKSIVLAKKNSQFKTNGKNPDYITYHKNYLSNGYHHLRDPSAGQLASLQMYTSHGGSRLGPECQILNLGQARTNQSSVSPHSHHSQGSFTAKANKKGDSLKLQAKLRKNFSGGTNVKSTINKSASHLNRIGATGHNPNPSSVFNLVKRNILTTNANNSQLTRGNSNSKSREPPKPCPLNLPNSNGSKNQISLTKDQLRNLIQKNIYKKTPQEVDRANTRGFDKSLSRSSKKRPDKLVINLYHQNTANPLKLTKPAEVSKKIH